MRAQGGKGAKKQICRSKEHQGRNEEADWAKSKEGRNHHGDTLDGRRYSTELALEDADNSHKTGGRGKHRQRERRKWNPGTYT